MTNRLAGAISPYLQQHADNPVDWFEWGSEAFDEARRRDVPVFLSVGYAACHWCHVMAHESFEDPATAAQLNEGFVSIKVDREERPDVDAVYMEATTALTGAGGWPMSCWLDHDGKVFLAGTYFPSEPMHGRPSFRQMLSAISDAWRTRRDDVQRSAASIHEALQQGANGGIPGPPADPLTVLDEAAHELAAQFDRVHAGFGGAPKFPPSMVLEFLLRHHELTGAEQSLELVQRTCAAMARGGIYDQLAGGFARYSVDSQWRVPHFEKMLYDNALLLRVYTHLWCRTDSDLARRIATETAEFLVRDLGTPEGGFAAALDADSVPDFDPGGRPVEGAAYGWTPDELDRALGPEDGEWAAQLLEVTVAGTFEHGRSTLTLRADPDDAERWARVRDRLLAARAERPQPMRDDKVVASWNGLAITALVQAGMVFDRPDWVEAAVHAGELLARLHLEQTPSAEALEAKVTVESRGPSLRQGSAQVDKHRDQVRLVRVSRDGRAGSAAGVLDDDGNVVEGFATLFAATGDPVWFDRARALTEAMVAGFATGDDSFADTAADSEQLVRRPRDPADNASPGGTSAAVTALVIMAALTDDQAWRVRAERTLAALAELQQNHPRFAGSSLAALAATAAGPTQVAVTGPADEPLTHDLLRAAFRYGRAGAVIATTIGSGPDTEVELLRDRAGAAVPTAYVCHGFVCHLPVTSAEDLAEQLDPPQG